MAKSKGTTKPAKAAKVAEEKEDEAKVAVEKEDDTEAAKVAEEKEDEAKVDFDTEIFFVEDPKFFEELEEKITDKANKDDFIFGDAKTSPEKCAIRRRDAKWESITTSGRGLLKGNKGDFLIKDPSGNKLRVTPKLFKEIYDKVVS